MDPWGKFLAQRWESSLAYLAGRLGQFLRPGDVVLLCLEQGREGCLESLARQAVALCGGRPISWETDHRWKSLLKLAFSSRAVAILAEPMVILGLSKLKSTQNTPLFIRTAVTVGYPCPKWVAQDIEKSLDCRCFHSFGLGQTGFLAGFSCPLGHIHLRQDAYALEVRDPSGRPVAEGEAGQWVLYPKGEPNLAVGLGQRCRIEKSPCPCGDPSPRVMDLDPPWDSKMADLFQYLHSWASVLDCRIRRGDYGLELEMVALPGLKLPILPSCARQEVRLWNPEQDQPFVYDQFLY